MLQPSRGIAPRRSQAAERRWRGPWWRAGLGGAQEGAQAPSLVAEIVDAPLGGFDQALVGDELIVPRHQLVEVVETDVYAATGAVQVVEGVLGQDVLR